MKQTYNSVKETPHDHTSRSFYLYVNMFYNIFFVQQQLVTSNNWTGFRFESSCFSAIRKTCKRRRGSVLENGFCWMLAAIKIAVYFYFC